jgi:hypothetical protein
MLDTRYFLKSVIKLATGLDLPTDRFLDGKDPTAALAGRASSPHKYLYRN